LPQISLQNRLVYQQETKTVKENAILRDFNAEQIAENSHPFQCKHREI